MLFSSPVFSQASGSVAGMVYSHGRSGMICRARTTPTNPNTARQRIIRVALATLGNLWGQTLTTAQRDAWRLYAENVAVINALGQTIFLSGQNHFTRVNVNRIQADISILLAAPTIFDLGTFTAPEILEINSLFQSYTITFDNTDDWANAAGGFMLIYGGRPTGPGRGFFGGPFRFAGKIVGAGTPPSSPNSPDSPWILSVDNIAWVLIRVIQVDGRMSLPIILGPETIIAV